MDMKQILIFGLFLVPVWTCSEEQKPHCYEQDKLEGKARRMLSRHYPQHNEVLPTAAPGPRACPTDLYRDYLPSHESGRSLSPWRYVNRTLPDHFPSTFYEAECLCKGCIHIQKSDVVENLDYNSVPLLQTKLFLKREHCGSGNQYRLQPVNVKVAVGCTCVRPESVRPRSDTDAHESR